MSNTTHILIDITCSVVLTAYVFVMFSVLHHNRRAHEAKAYEPTSHDDDSMPIATEEDVMHV